MRLSNVVREWSADNNWFPLVFMGDFHLGSPHCRRDLLEQHISDIEPYALVWLMGDLAEWIVHTDRRFNIEQIDKRYWSELERLPEAYLDDLCDLLAPIAGQIVCLHDGNHEKKMRPYMKSGYELCVRLGLREAYSPGQSYTKVRLQRSATSDKRSVMVNTAHGNQAGRKSGAKHNASADRFAWTGANVIMRAHSHERFVTEAHPRETPNPGMTKIIREQQIYGHTGSYLDGRAVSDDPCYAETADYPPLPMGHVRVNVHIEKKGITMTTEER